MGRINTGGVAHCAGVIGKDLIDRNSGLYASHVKGLADLAAAALASRSVNTAEWIPLLPRETGSAKSRERYISRLLSNKRIERFAVMKKFAEEIVGKAGSNNQTAILMLDQSKIREGFECLMVSLRIGERAIPLAWCVIQTKGAIGFDVQEELLNKLETILPKDVSILLSADRFYGTAALIDLCQKKRWQYRIRLKGNLTLQHKGGEISTGDAARLGINDLSNAKLGEVVTHIGILHEAGHPEPWVIAMDCRPSKWRTMDYGMRWGIESMFSDMKSRGFCITKTQLKHTDRIERLILVLTIAIYWAVSTGMAAAAKSTGLIKARSMTSFFKQGLRLILTAVLTLTPLPKLWEAASYVGW
jgi:hypothetical protein